MLPAFADVRAMRFLAHGMQVELPHHVLEAHVVVATGGLHLQPLRLPLWQRIAAVAAHDLVQRVGHDPNERGQTDPGIPGRLKLV